MTKIQRTTFKTSRAAQYVEASALQAMTGQSGFAFASVVIKELMDNAFDACETARVAPEVFLGSSRSPGEIQITVSNNADGIPPDTVRGALDFNVLVSDKAAYRSPTRGAQGNALKTVFGIPYALGSVELVVVEAKGLRQEARVWKDPSSGMPGRAPCRPPTKASTRVPWRRRCESTSGRPSPATPRSSTTGPGLSRAPAHD
jgi:hypothetical protein